LTAAAAGEAPEIDNVPKWGMFERPGFTIPFNVTGQPALTVCAGYGERGLPVAIQLVGRPFDDAGLLAAGHAYETAHGWRGVRPALAL
jgi:aspartyl-tRNA(Asn)/glutamyl-tRNA(Gln) amidotransferase subunit A